MHLLDPVVLGVVILVLLRVLVAVKQVSTGSVLDRPGGTFLVRLVNLFNLFFLLILNPLAAVGLLRRSLLRIDPTHAQLAPGSLLLRVKMIGLLLYFGGFGLMAWELITLGRIYQLGGTAPRRGDDVVLTGLYRSIRHPVYSAAISISLGLACLIQSLAFLAVFVIYLVWIIPLIRLEEQQLLRVDGKKYAAYQHGKARLVPLVY